ncbi:MAG: 50S ribosomal protein L2 [Candidatus Berkelbacteria bacterium]|nr:50S ribosomal protein L2 [Candidatus Berkelbacteria bacterium]
MPIIKVKPTTNARRQMTYLVRNVDKVKPEKSLTFGFVRGSGRNHNGQLVVMHKGGGAKRKYRIIDFNMTSHLDQKAVVESIQFDPNRSADIALIKYPDGEKVYILCPDGLVKGQTVICGDSAPAKLGNRLKLRNIPLSTSIFNIEMTQGKGGQLCRSAGNFATLQGLDGSYALLRMPSGEIRKVLSENYATIGISSNIDHNKVVIGKAGRKRHMGVRPTVLGKEKNPVDHPHGGGEGHSPIGMKYPKTPWGAPALGKRTRNKKKKSSKLIISRRSK